MACGAALAEEGNSTFTLVSCRSEAAREPLMTRNIPIYPTELPQQSIAVYADFIWQSRVEHTGERVGQIGDYDFLAVDPPGLRARDYEQYAPRRGLLLVRRKTVGVLDHNSQCALRIKKYLARKLKD